MKNKGTFLIVRNLPEVKVKYLVDRVENHYIHYLFIWTLKTLLTAVASFEH